MQPLDFEAQEEHILILTVENLNPLSNKAPSLPVSTATVVVTVVNENEAPRFREEPIQIAVLESVLPGTLLKSNIAFDPDNSNLRYHVATKHEQFLCFRRADQCGSLCDYNTSTAFFVAGMRLSGIPRGGWTSAETQETLLPGETST